MRHFPWLALPLLAVVGHSAQAPHFGGLAVAAAPVEFTLIKGDTRQGSKIHVRIEGDSLHYRRTEYGDPAGPVETSQSVRLDARRKISLKNLLGDLPRLRTFGSCFGEGMRYYLVETPVGKFYRSLPERTSRCFSDEPDVWPMLENLEDLLAPPEVDEAPKPLS